MTIIISEEESPACCDGDHHVSCTSTQLDENVSRYWVR